MDNATRYFGKVTDRETYRYVNILEYVDDSYVITNKISDTNLIEMRNNMDDSDIEGFDKFVEENWGVRVKDGFAGVEVIGKPKKQESKEKSIKATKARKQTHGKNRKHYKKGGNRKKSKNSKIKNVGAISNRSHLGKS